MKKNKTNSNVTKEDHIVVNGTVIECLPGTRFLVKIDNLNNSVKCTLAGKLRTNKIIITDGDRVEVKLSPYDLSSGIISWRLRDE